MLVALVAIHSSETAHRQTLVFPHEHQRFFIPPLYLRGLPLHACLLWTLHPSIDPSVVRSFLKKTVKKRQESPRTVASRPRFPKQDGVSTKLLA